MLTAVVAVVVVVAVAKLNLGDTKWKSQEIY